MTTYDLAVLSNKNLIEVAGTHFYQSDCQAMFREEGGEDRDPFNVAVTLVPEPDNPHDDNGQAISVRWNDRVIGYLPQKIAGDYQQLRRVTASGCDPQINARVFAYKDLRGKREFDVTIDLPDPKLLLPLNNPPADGFVVLPVGRKLQAVKEKEHLDVLVEYLPPLGFGHILLSMHVVPAGGRSNKNVVELRLDGQRVGEMSSASSEKFEPAVEYFSDLGLECLTHGTITGSSLSCEVEVFALKAYELAEDFLSPVETKPLPQLVEYQEDPTLYNAPNRYQSSPLKKTPKPQGASRPQPPVSNPQHNSYSTPGYPPQASVKAPQAKSTMVQPPKGNDVISLEEWQGILRPDGTKRATGYQRGYVRAKIAQHSADNKAPRLDFITFGQCQQVLAKLGEDPSILMKGGRNSQALWWTQNGCLIPFVIFVIMLITPKFGSLVLLAWIGWGIYRFSSRKKLQPPFNDQSLRTPAPGAPAIPQTHINPQSNTVPNQPVTPPPYPPQSDTHGVPTSTPAPVSDLLPPANTSALSDTENAITTETPETVEGAEWIMPTYQGKPICDWVSEVKALKRDENFEDALVIAQGCMDSMVEVAKLNPTNAMEYYVKEVVILQQKIKDPQTVITTLEDWFSLGIPAPREDYRVDLQKRLAKAKQCLARELGEDSAPYTEEFNRLKALEQEIKARPGKSSAVSTGKSLFTTGTIGPVFASPGTRISARSHHSEWVPSAQALSKSNFVAVDFETANNSKVSACQVALIKVENGVITDRVVTLLRPPAEYGAFELSHIHGITQDMVTEAPQWSDSAKVLKGWLGDLPVYAHNAAFDREVWAELDAYYGTETLPQDFYCSYRTAREFINLPNYKLPTVVQALAPDFKLQHHDAASDAEACARIILALQKM